MNREENLPSEVDNANFLAASLEISRGAGGTCLAALWWPRGGLCAQNEVDLEPIISKLSAYRTCLDFFVESLPETDQSKSYASEQIDMANTIWLAINQGNIANLLENLVDYAVQP